MSRDTKGAGFVKGVIFRNESICLFLNKISNFHASYHIKESGGSAKEIEKKGFLFLTCLPSALSESLFKVWKAAKFRFMNTNKFI